MDERDYKAINEELNPPLQQCSVMLSLPDIRNKLTPISNLIAMLESSELMYHHKPEVHKIIEAEIKQCKKSIAYLVGNGA